MIYMKRHRHDFLLQLSVACLIATGVAAAETNDSPCWNSTNRLTLSLRYGLNISARFRGIGGSLRPSNSGLQRLTPNGDRYNYDDGYVLRDNTGNFGDQTWYWGYDDNSVQVINNTIEFHRRTTDIPADPAAQDQNDPGVELAYHHELGVKENWHHMRYGFEAAANYLPISLSLNQTFAGTLNRTTDAYPFTPGTTPPNAPYQGSFQGPGFVIGSVPVTSTTTFLSDTTGSERESFDANLWGFRLGPYLEFPFCRRFSILASGGLAVGLLESSASWRQTIDIPGENLVSYNGHSHDLSLLWGYYASATAVLKISERWSIEGGVQFQDLGKYSQRLGFRKVELDFRHSIFLLAGISYTF